MDHAIEETAQLIPDQLIQNCTERVSTYQRDYAIKSESDALLYIRMWNIIIIIIIAKLILILW